jgi:hypothetical protein
VLSSQSDRGAQAWRASLKSSARYQKDQQPQTTLRQKPRSMKVRLSSRVTINALANQAMMLARGPAAQTIAGIGFIEQLVLGLITNGRTPCSQARKPPTLPERHAGQGMAALVYIAENRVTDEQEYR